MPKIREYGAPNLEYGATYVSSTKGLEQEGAVAQAQGNLGNAISNVGEAIYKRKAQQQTSDLNAQTAELNSQAVEEIDQATRDGSINTEKYMEDFSKRVDQMGSEIDTADGRMAFERNASMLKARAFKMASRAESAVIGAKAAASMESQWANYSSSLQSKPEMFQSNAESMLAAIDDQVSTGALKATDAEKLKRHALSEMAQGAVRGYAKMDPKFADEKLNQGQFDKYLNGDQRSQMQKEINQMHLAKEAEANRREAQMKRAEKKTADAWMDQNLKGIVDGTLDTDSILSAPGLKPQTKMSLIKTVNANAADGGGVSNPRIKNKVTEKILSGEITDVTEFIDQVGNGLSVKDLGDLNLLIAKTPQGEAMIDGEKRLFELAKKTLGQKDPMSSSFLVDDSAEYNISRFMSAYQRAKAEAAKQDIPVSELTNPDSKHYFGNKVKEYKKTPQQILEHKAQIMKKEAENTVKGVKMIEVKSPEGKVFKMPEANFSKLPKGWSRN